MNNFKRIALALCLAFYGSARAHDEGHGPKVTDTGIFGGVVTAVVNQDDAGLGAKAALVYKAELVRSEDGTVRVYLYDKDMKKLALDVFEKKADAVLIAHRDGKDVEIPFSLTLQGSSFVGKSPEAPSKPYNIDVIYKSGDKKYLSAFDNLD